MLRCLALVPIVPCIVVVAYFIVAGLVVLMSEPNRLETLLAFITDKSSLGIVLFMGLILFFMSVIYYGLVMMLAYLLQRVLVKVNKLNFFSISLCSFVLSVLLVSFFEFQFPPPLKALLFISSIGWFYSSIFWFLAYRAHLKNLEQPTTQSVDHKL